MFAGIIELKRARGRDRRIRVSMKENSSLFETESVWKILLKIAPPVMLAQLIQALYNIVDSFFVGKYSGDGLTALSIIFPIQLIITAIAVGTGVGVNTLMSRHYAHRETEKANATAGTGMALAIVSWAVFAILSTLLMRPFVTISAESAGAVEYAVTYGNIVCIGSLGIFMESMWSKVHQAGGNMRLPMVAQIAGALTNIVLDPVMIFGWAFVPAMGIAGAAYATIIGQFVAALITISGFRKPPQISELLQYAKRIYQLGYPSILMQGLYTVYIVILNMILAGFSDEAVTVLGLYYKLQSFFFIPLSGLQTCIVPLLSYTYAQQAYERCKKVMTNAVILSMAFMLVGVACFELIPVQLLGLFSDNELVFSIGENAFRIIGLSFVPIVLSLMTPVFFQAIGAAIPSVLLSLARQIFCLVPLFWAFSRLGLAYAWWAFPVSEVIVGTLGVVLYRNQLKKWNVQGTSKKEERIRGEITMKMVTAIVNRKDSNEVCQALTEAGFYFTKMASTGGFLTAGNTTLMIGTENDKVERVIEIIRSHCSRRVEEVTTMAHAASQTAAYPAEVTVGGATVFVTAVEQFEKM